MKHCSSTLRKSQINLRYSSPFNYLLLWSRSMNPLLQSLINQPYFQTSDWLFSKQNVQSKAPTKNLLIFICVFRWNAFDAFGETFGFRPGPELRTLNFDILASFSLVHILKRRKRRLVSITHIEFPDTYGHICQEFKNLYAILFFSVLWVEEIVPVWNLLPTTTWNSFFLFVLYIARLNKKDADLQKILSSFGVLRYGLSRKVNESTKVRMSKFGGLSSDLINMTWTIKEISFEQEKSFDLPQKKNSATSVSPPEPRYTFERYSGAQLRWCLGARSQIFWIWFRLQKLKAHGSIPSPSVRSRFQVYKVYFKSRYRDHIPSSKYRLGPCPSLAHLTCEWEKGKDKKSHSKLH